MMFTTIIGRGHSVKVSERAQQRLKYLAVLLLLMAGSAVSAQSINVTNATPTTLCSGSSITLTFTAVNGPGNGSGNKFSSSTSYTAYIGNGTQEAALGGSFTVSATYATGANASTAGLTRTVAIPAGLSPGSYKIFIDASNPLVNSTFSSGASGTITVTGSIGGVVSPTQTICTGTQPANIAVSGNTGSVIRWERSSEADFSSDVTTISSTSTTLTGSSIGNLSSTTYFRAVVQSGSCAAVNSQGVEITVNSTSNFYADVDGDGFGNPGAMITNCTGIAPAGYVSNSSDCDDNAILYLDADGDGFGSQIAVACSGVANTSDCDDSMIMYQDNDGDGFGSTVMVACNGVTNTTDCNDASAAINPGAAEVASNGVDDNCNGTIDEGSQVTTQVQSSQCGSTLVAMNSIIYAVSKTGATGYRFQITNNATNAVQVIDRPLRWFSLDMLPQYDYSATYSIRVMLQMNGIWLGYYGSACNVNSPAVTSQGGAAQIIETQCGNVLPSIGTIISSNSVQNTTIYRFRVTNLTDPNAPNQVQIIDRTLRWFSLTMLNTYSYGTSYLVEVAVRTTGPFTGYGSSCIVTTPDVSSLVTCGVTISSPSEVVMAINKEKSTSYRFELTNLLLNQVTTIDRPVRWFTFSMVPNYMPGAEYGVRVSSMTTGNYSPFGDACVITAPGGAKAADKPQTAQELTAIAYPNPFASSVTIEVHSTEASSIKVYDMTGRLLESTAVISGVAEIGTQYPAGVYNVIVTEGTRSKTLRIVKR